MQKPPLHAAGGALPQAQTSRRALLGAIAAAPLAVAATTPALAEGNDAELLALEAEIRRLNDIADDITAKRIEPFEQGYTSLVDRGMKRAFAYSKRTGRETAIDEVTAILKSADRLFERMGEIPARTKAGQAAKVRALIRHVLGDEWRGKANEIDWHREQSRALLGELAGMSAEELAAI